MSFLQNACGSGLPRCILSRTTALRTAVVGRVPSAIFQQGDIDVIEYVEAYMEVLTALGDAENDLYSANFADYSGGGGTKVSANESQKTVLDL